MAIHLPRSSIGSIPPSYTQGIELSRFDSPTPSTSTILSDPPSYTEAASSFHPTVHLQIETEGKSWRSLPLPPDNVPIAVFALHPQDSSVSVASQSTPRFTSFRPERFSGSCYLVSSDAATSPDSDAIPALATTTYRCGPNRPPRVRLFSPHSTQLSPTTLASILFPKKTKPQESASEPGDQPEPQQTLPDPWDDFTITSLGLLTRAVTFRTRLGTFEWRYASRRERHALSRALGGQDVSSLLVLERVTRIARAQNLPSSSSSSSAAAALFGAGKKKDSEEKIRTTVAQFIRGDGTRTAGTGASDAGNGGRLVVDLSLWDGEGESKLDREMAGVMVVATCLVMLKREVDRRRAQQVAILAGAASGGGP
jgi:hypothetical protein